MKGGDRVAYVITENVWLAEPVQKNVLPKPLKKVNPM